MEFDGCCLDGTCKWASFSLTLLVGLQVGHAGWLKGQLGRWKQLVRCVRGGELGVEIEGGYCWWWKGEKKRHGMEKDMRPSWRCLAHEMQKRALAGALQVGRLWAGILNRRWRPSWIWLLRRGVQHVGSLAWLDSSLGRDCRSWGLEGGCCERTDDGSWWCDHPESEVV